MKTIEFKVANDHKNNGDTVAFLMARHLDGDLGEPEFLCSEDGIDIYEIDKRRKIELFHYVKRGEYKIKFNPKHERIVRAMVELYEAVYREGEQ
jgi:hypothetical protein